MKFFAIDLELKKKGERERERIKGHTLLMSKIIWGKHNLY